MFSEIKKINYSYRFFIQFVNFFQICECPERNKQTKLLEVVSEGPHATEVRRTPIKHCINCANELLSVTLCEVCQCGDYYSCQCLMNHVNHKQYCAAICSLEKLEAEKRMKKDILVSETTN